MLIQSNWTQDRPYCIYMHISPSNKIYVGQTCQRLLCRRFGYNGKRYINTPVFYKAIQKYGWKNFNHEIVAENLTKGEANALEIELISKYKKLGISYNITNGGEGSVGRICTEETRKKISSANRGKRHTFTEEQRKSISEGLRGKKHSPERILKNSISHIGQTASNKGKIVVHCGDVQKYIYKTDLEIYVNNGWVRGASPKVRAKYNERWNNMSDESKENIRRAQRERVVTQAERIKKSRSHTKHGKYVNSKYI